MRKVLFIDDDVLWSVSLLGHLSPFLSSSLTLRLDYFLGGRSTLTIPVKSSLSIRGTG